MPKHKPPSFPDDADLRRLIHFSAVDGRIWLAGQRMLLLHAASLGALRRELMQTVGAEQTRRCFTRAGFDAGERDGALAKRVRAAEAFYDLFAVGPQLHMLEGMTQVTPLRFDADPQTGHFHGEFLWSHSWEADVHVRDFGIQERPVCWMLIGYASGYTSALMGRTILYKEVECAGCGHAHCRIVGKPQEQWEDADDLASYFRPESMLRTLEDLQTQVESLRLEIAGDADKTQLIGQSEAFRKAYALLQTAAPTQVTVLLNGETGVGKERFARALQALSNRADKPFVAINCAAIPHELIESELFGAEKGAYTGSQAARPGRFERADGGTLFLDEIGELPLTAQAKLLRVIQEGEVERLGAAQSRKIDVRLVTATNRDLEQAVKEGQFRADLFYRINVYPITIPPLRERRDDIEPLVHAMLERFAALHGKPVPLLSDHAYDALHNYNWPGNVRELENLVERAVILSRPGAVVEAQDLFPGIGLPSGVGIDVGGKLARHRANAMDCGALLEQLQHCGVGIEELEHSLLYEAVNRTKGNLSAAARLLGLSRAKLSYRLGRDEDMDERKS
ncbi:MAG: sigma 54-interacting transcriptional regulator [Thiomonas sp.]|uniref:sigma 54-interacting transcriptional regulator n=1 Tax=Thiomonas sp. TaxID=2047785 RepID=UPI002A366557|nr:sigma 54-interacting transcriptional regulator [Thiomonas sp.]MDY0329163.1 sigma 54-interacting transcriptional regulator [Thiomonas sp.]